MIILTTVNARYSHASFGLRWLLANMGDLQEKTVIKEYNLNQPVTEIAENLLLDSPVIIGFGVYIWNVEIITGIVRTIKQVSPETVIVLGGPEVSFEYEGTELFETADYLVCGEGEKTFPLLAEKILNKEAIEKKVIRPDFPDLGRIEFPYNCYEDEDVKNRLIYVEASRGCPFGCEFCLSSIDNRVRYFPVYDFLVEMKRLIERGVWQFKFVDRTFNLKKEHVRKILSFFKENWVEGMRLHFEIVPDLLDDEMFDAIAEFPPAGLHLEAGIQTLNQKSLAAISRKQNNEKALKNIKRLKTETGALIHADLVAGLPYETWDSFKDSFDGLFASEPHNIQVGILKRLKGAPIARHTEECKMVYAKNSPYEILKNDNFSFFQMQEIKRFARYFDVYFNSEKYPNALPLLWKTGGSPFDVFMDFSRYLWKETKSTASMSLVRQVKFFYEYLVSKGFDSKEDIEAALIKDYYKKPGRNDRLPFIDIKK